MNAEQLLVRIAEMEEWLTKLRGATLLLNAARVSRDRAEDRMFQMRQTERSLIRKLESPKPHPPKNQKCPTPGKKAFPNPDFAIRAVLSASRGYGKPMRYYRCVCGQWHMTKKVGR